MKRILLSSNNTHHPASCQDKKFGTFTVNGKIEHAPGQKITLEELPYGGQQPVIIDSGSLKPNGKFELRGMGKEEGLYRLVIENGPDVLLVNDGKSITVNLDINNYRAYKVEGSPASEACIFCLRITAKKIQYSMQHLWNWILYKNKMQPTACYPLFVQKRCADETDEYDGV
jgi:hypothetical protein